VGKMPNLAALKNPSLKFLNGDLDMGDFQNSINSSLAVDASVVNFHDI